MTTPPQEVASRTAEQFADKIFQAALGTMETLNLYLGDQLGWFDALAEAPATATARRSACPTDSLRRRQREPAL